MSKARNISNLFSSNTDISTDAELNTHATAANGHTSRGDTASRPGSASQGDTYFNTELGLLEVYDTGRWTTANAAPVAPSSVVATNQPTGRAFNNGQASIAFTAPTTGGRVNTYTVTSSPGSYTNTGSSSPIVLTGLQSSTQYTYSITSTNGVGTSAASESSSGVTATTVPQAPTIGTATGASASATLTFTAGSTGGATISNYKYSTDGTTYTAFSPSQTTSPLTISGLTDGTSYSFYLKAVNANGDSIASSASNSVTPLSVTYAYESIATLYGTGGSTISFTSIPNTYKHLEIRVLAKDTGSGTDSDGIGVTFNGDTGANYWSQTGGSYQNNNLLTGQTTSAGTYIDAGLSMDGGQTSGWHGYSIYKITDYTSTAKNKTLHMFTGSSSINNAGYAFISSGMWTTNNAAINRIDLKALGATQTFSTSSRFMLFGIKG
jgi:hypothetical protein